MSASSPGVETAQDDRATAVHDRPLADDRPRGVAPAAEPSAAAAPWGAAHARHSVPRAGIGIVGLLTLVFGAWGGIVPFVGPTFGFSADGTSAWYWSTAHALLWLAPGAVAVACAFLVLGLMSRATAGVARARATFLGLIVAACGAWLVIGPAAWPVLEHTGRVFVSASALRQLEYYVGYSLGPGLLLGVLGGFTMGWAVRSRPLPLVLGAPGEVPA